MTTSNESSAAYTPRPERIRFEDTENPDDFLRWLNAYTNEKGRGDDELHALCSWAHSVVNALARRAAS